MESASKVPSNNISRVKIPWWKRTYLVNREFQFRFARSSLVVGVVSSFVSAIMILWAFWAFNIWQGQRLPNAVIAAIIGSMIINFAGIFFVSVFATHKIVGPIFNLLRNFQHIGRGDFSVAAKFREDDEMHYVARRFNEMVMLLRLRNEFFYAQVELIKSSLDSSDIDSAKAALHAIQLIRNNEISEGTHE